MDTGRTVAWFSIEDLGCLDRRHGGANDMINKAVRCDQRDLIMFNEMACSPSVRTSPKPSDWSTSPANIQ